MTSSHLTQQGKILTADTTIIILLHSQLELIIIIMNIIPCNYFMPFESRLLKNLLSIQDLVLLLVTGAAVLQDVVKENQTTVTVMLSV